MTTVERVRVGVLGAGAIAQVAHLPILSRMRGVELAALCDVDRSKADTLAERFGVARVHGSAEELWADPALDAVIVCTPSHLHEEQVRAGLRAGKYVFCEKPLALDARGVAEVLGIEGADARLMVGMNQRFRPDVVALRSFVQGGDLGDVFYVRAGWLNRRARRSRHSWRQRKSGAGGGALMDLGVQMLDLALWLLGYPEPRGVTAHLHRSGGEVEDSAVLLLDLGEGRAVNLEVTWSLLAERERQYLHLLGTAGSASLAPLRVVKELDGDLADVTPPIAPGRENLYTASYRQELSLFLETVRNGGRCPPPREHATLMRVVDAAYRSARQGSQVSLGSGPA